MSIDEEQVKAKVSFDRIWRFTYFKKEGYKVNSENVKLEGHSGVRGILI